MFFNSFSPSFGTSANNLLQLRVFPSTVGIERVLSQMCPLAGWLRSLGVKADISLKAVISREASLVTGRVSWQRVIVTRCTCPLSGFGHSDAPDPQHFCPTFETLVIQNAVAHLQGAIPRFAC
jgi:hypothetical protein